MQSYLQVMGAVAEDFVALPAASVSLSPVGLL
jgi:hypothetical protein